MIEQNKLIGIWKLESDPSKEYGEDVVMKFEPDGKLTYTITEEGKKQIILLTYILKDDFLVTNQPSEPREEQTKILSLTESRLTLNFSGILSSYTKIA